MAFTTWQALLTIMQDDLASGNWRRQSYTINDVTQSYVKFSEFKAALEYVETRARLETGGSSAPAGRTYAKQGGGGRW